MVSWLHSWCNGTNGGSVGASLRATRKPTAPTPATAAATTASTAEFQSRGLALNEFLTYIPNCATCASWSDIQSGARRSRIYGTEHLTQLLDQISPCLPSLLLQSRKRWRYSNIHAKMLQRENPRSLYISLKESFNRQFHRRVEANKSNLGKFGCWSRINSTFTRVKHLRNAHDTANRAAMRRSLTRNFSKLGSFRPASGNPDPVYSLFVPRHAYFLPTKLPEIRFRLWQILRQFITTLLYT